MLLNNHLLSYAGRLFAKIVLSQLSTETCLSIFAVCFINRRLAILTAADGAVRFNHQLYAVAYCLSRFMTTETRNGDQLVTMAAAGSVSSRSRLVSTFVMGATAPAKEVSGVPVSWRLH